MPAPASTAAAVHAVLGTAEVRFDGSELTMTTGRIRRTWRWTGHGFVTTTVCRTETGHVWSGSGDNGGHAADWQIPTVEGDAPEAILTAVTCEESDDEGFTSPHLAVTADMDYPAACLGLRFCVWAYPGAPGLRTHLAVRALEGFAWDGALHKRETTEASLRIARLDRGWQRVERLPVEWAGTGRRYVGYHIDLQNRNDTFTAMLKEHTRDCEIRLLETCDWASVAFAERGGEALALVKESHKCVNQKGHDTGIFRCRPGVGMESLGWGVLPGEIGTAWTPGWASWCLVGDSDPTGREDMLKTFDRLRYPVRAQDVFTQANTWGSSEGYRQHRDAAGEENVLRELESAKDLGIDLVQIDDGWQGNQYEEWTPAPPRYPQGWQRVKEQACALGVRLGLWAATKIPGEALQWNYDEAGFVWYKLDFACLRNHADVHALMAKVRAFLLHTGHQARVNWDMTEVAPRYGYWFAREYGALYCANRKPAVPHTAVYRPHTVLRDLWEQSRYLNLSKILGPIQNVDRVNPLLSDAAVYGHAYGVAATLFALPTFFLETQFYDEAARRDIRPLLELHRQYREAIRKGITYPVGQTPDGASWTGFQNHRADDRAGLLLVFRELANESDTGTIALRHVQLQCMHFTDLCTGRQWTASADREGRVDVTIPEAPGFQVLAYKVEP